MCPRVPNFMGGKIGEKEKKETLTKNTRPKSTFLRYMSKKNCACSSPYHLLRHDFSTKHLGAQNLDLPGSHLT